MKLPSKKTILRISVALVIVMASLLLVLARSGVEKLFIFEFKHASNDQQESIVSRFMVLMTPEQLLHAIETGFKVCHAPAHQVGKAVYARTNNISESLAICQNRCGGGCFHGVLIKMFSSDSAAIASMTASSSTATLDEKATDVFSLCKSDAVRDNVTIWRCVHGAGHVLMFSAQYDIQKALSACSKLPESLQPSCRTGAFMEFMLREGFDEKAKSTEMYPCDTYPEWSCFFTRANSMIRDHGWKKSVAACETLPQKGKIACLHGLGAALFYNKPDIVKTDGLIEKSCNLHDKDEEAACEDGFIARYVTTIDDTSDKSCDSAAPSYRQLCVQKLHAIRSSVM